MALDATSPRCRYPQRARPSLGNSPSGATPNAIDPAHYIEISMGRTRRRAGYTMGTDDGDDPYRLPDVPLSAVSSPEHLR